MGNAILLDRPREYHVLVKTALSRHGEMEWDAILDEVCASVSSKINEKIFCFANEDRAHLLAAYPAHGMPGSLAKLQETILFQAIESCWCEGLPIYDNEAALNNLSCLVDFHKNRNMPAFSYVLLRELPWTRIPNAVRRRLRMLFNTPGRNTMGLKVTVCPEVTLTYINELCSSIGNELGLSSPYPLMVTSVLRTVDHQRHLAKIGYYAPTRSSHLSGYAIDIERSWYAVNAPNVYNLLEKRLETDFSLGKINMMNFGGFWHVCLRPGYFGI